MASVAGLQEGGAGDADALIAGLQVDEETYDDIPEHAGADAENAVKPDAAHASMSSKHSSDTKMGALKMASKLKGLDTSKVVVDDEDQASPTVEAGSAEEAALLQEMEGLLAPGSSAQSASGENQSELSSGQIREAISNALHPDQDYFHCVLDWISVKKVWKWLLAFKRCGNAD